MGGVLSDRAVAILGSESFERAWADVGDRVFGLLRSRGIDRATSEDIVQETAARVLERVVPYESNDDLFRWAAVVAWRLAIDDARRRRRLPVEVVPDRQSPIDVEREVEGRAHLSELGRRLAELS